MSEIGETPQSTPEVNQESEKQTLSEKTIAFFGNLHEKHKYASIMGSVFIGSGIGDVMLRSGDPVSAVVWGGIGVGAGVLMDRFENRPQSFKNKLKDQ